MSTDAELTSLQCPVCRARQPLQPVCRRCQADLTLYVRALRSWAVAESRCHPDGSDSDGLIPTLESNAARWQAYRDWLRPARGKVT